MWVDLSLAPYSVKVARPADVWMHLLWVVGLSVALVWWKDGGRGREDQKRRF